ncbi:MAG: YciI family protein [Propionicimonas sp.]
MKYLILIHQNPGAREQFAAMPPEAQAQGMQAYYDLNAELAGTGELVSAEALADDTTATVLSLRSGSVVASDGPFAEAKELLAGFYLVDVNSRERAVEIATKIPELQAGAGSVEVRPVMDTAAMA